MNLRTLNLPSGVPGKIYLTSMPGRSGNFSADRTQIENSGIDTVLCLSPLDEVERAAAGYATAIKSNDLPWKQVMLPMEDFGVSKDKDGWLAEIMTLADHVKGGGTILVHCYAGIGRTGTAATCLLIALGDRREAAAKRVVQAGSNPEDPRQRSLIKWAAETFGRT
jgi:atypical dual specificity phosphatase